MGDEALILVSPIQLARPPWVERISYNGNLHRAQIDLPTSPLRLGAQFADPLRVFTGRVNRFGLQDESESIRQRLASPPSTPGPGAWGAWFLDVSVCDASGLSRIHRTQRLKITWDAPWSQVLTETVSIYFASLGPLQDYAFSSPGSSGAVSQLFQDLARIVEGTRTRTWPVTQHRDGLDGGTVTEFSTMHEAHQERF